jgi:hypothetical protein
MIELVSFERCFGLLLDKKLFRMSVKDSQICTCQIGWTDSCSSKVENQSELKNLIHMSIKKKGKSFFFVGTECRN